MLEWTGERYVPWMEEGEIHYEHLHRYRFVKELVKHKKVLDLGCGEGYGSFVLAEESDEVIGIDIDGITIRHASSKYIKENLKFILGSIIEIPIKGEKIFDVIVCFEAIEHISEHDKLIGEVKRLIKDNGIFIVSTPNKYKYSDQSNFQNQFHLKELYFDEFKTLLNNSFKNVLIYGQKVYPSSNIFPLFKKTTFPQDFVIEKGEKEFFFSGPEKKEAMYFVALSSNSPIEHLVGNSYLLDLSETLFRQKDAQISSLERLVGDKEAALNQKEAQISSLERLVGDKEAALYQKEAALNRIYASYGWKALLTFYRLFEKIFPINTKRRLLATILFKLVTHPRGILKNLNKRNLKESSGVSEPRPLKMEFERNISVERIEDLNFPYYSQPLVSIIIPVRNKWRYTYACLKSILQNTKEVPFEVIIVNDQSTDETPEVLGRISGIQIINNPINLGWVKNCNNAAKHAKGRYILLLNNDTEVREGWLANLVQLAENDEKIGVVGGKILFPDGRLQEAGSVMDMEGWGQPYGRFDDPDRYEYNYLKETDFITGACLLIRKDAFLKIGGFDERYSPAFYEEFDLEFAMREIGYKIIYQPKAVIVHHQSSSYRSEIRDSLSNINHSKFMKKWAKQIWGQNANSSIFLARDRSKDKKVIIFVDEKVPDYDKHAGSLSTFQYIKLLHEMGFKLIFIPDSLKPLEPYATELQQAGIEVVYGPFEFKSWIKCNGRYIHYVWLSRPDVAIKYVKAIKRHSKAKILYYTVDLHYLRELRRYQIEKRKEILDESIRLKKIEFYLFKNVDVILTPSDQEQNIIREAFPQKRIVTIPVIYYEANSIVEQNLTDFDRRHGIIFLGGFDHLPNVDAVKWFTSDIFPVIKGKLPEIKLYIAGSNPPPEIAAFNNNDIIVMGYVKDLEQIFKTKRVFVSPLRYGAGVKGKIITSMSYGVPVVTTCVGNEGINLRNGVEAFIVDDPVGFADRTVELYTNPGLWINFSRNSHLFVKNNFSKVKAKNMMSDIFGIIREKCSVCGALINFSPADTVKNLRETTVCHFCSSLSRTMDLAECILKVNGIPLTSSLLESLAKFKDLYIYELAHMGPIYEIFSRLPHFTWSEYFEEVTPGTFGPSGVRCEDVQQLTFKENTFDLIISQDVFEHVPYPKRGFREIFRVLKPGGYHIFTVPFDRNTPKSVTRAVIGTTKELKHILEPIHHGDPIRSEGALVFSDFGRDLIDTLNTTGFEVEIFERHYPRYRGGYNAVFLTKKEG